MPVFDILIFPNGDSGIAPTVFAVDTRALKSFDVLRQALTDTVRLRTGKVLKIYTTTGDLIRSVSELRKDRAYVVATKEPFKHVPYRVPAGSPDHPEARFDLRTVCGYVEHPRSPVETSARQGSPTWFASQSTVRRTRNDYTSASKAQRSRGSRSPARPLVTPRAPSFQTGRPVFLERNVCSKKVIWVFRNNDPQSLPTRIVVSKQRFVHWPRFIDGLNTQCGAGMRILRLFHFEDGVADEVTRFVDLKDGHFYISCGWERVMLHCRYRFPRHTMDLPPSDDDDGGPSDTFWQPLFENNKEASAPVYDKNEEVLFEPAAAGETDGGSESSGLHQSLTLFSANGEHTEVSVSTNHSSSKKSRSRPSSARSDTVEEIVETTKSGSNSGGSAVEEIVDEVSGSDLVKTSPRPSSTTASYVGPNSDALDFMKQLEGDI